MLLTNDINAAVVQMAPFGLPFWSKNYLLIGLPLLQSLTTEEVEAVIAHEFGHLKGKHGLISSWIYRVRVVWQQVLETLETRPHWGNAPFRMFLEWFAPYFAAYSFVLARSDEYFADRQAAKAAGAGNVASALTRVSIDGALYEGKFWHQFMQTAQNDPVPATRPFTESRAFFRTGANHEDRESVFRDVLDAKSGFYDTHPCLSDRLAALDQTGTLPSYRHESADSALLAQSLPSLEKELNETWETENLERWQALHEDLSYAQSRRQELEAREPSQPLTEDEELELAGLVFHFDGHDAALEQYRKILERFPASALPNYMVGEALFRADDPRCIDHLRAVIGADPELTEQACDLAIAFLEERQDEAASEFHQRKEAFAKEARIAAAERAYLDEDSELSAPTFTERQRDKLTAAFESVPEIGRAYVVRKQVTTWPHIPCLFLVVEGRDGKLILANDEMWNQLFAKVAPMGLDSGLALDFQSPSLKERIKTTPGALMFER